MKTNSYITFWVVLEDVLVAH